ncbi:MAG: glutamine cyclotransferase [Gammaproteobacteria bacterium]|jgi:glutamine cyclotransferase
MQTSDAVGRAAPLIKWRVVDAHPHDRQAFTQGLLFYDGLLYESTGRRGHSQLRAVRPHDGRVLRRLVLPATVFAEGLARIDQQLVQLTWQAGRGFVYALDDFRLVREFTYPGEGWGLAFDGKHLLMSDGSAQLRVLDARNFTELRRINVHHDGAPVTQLNELEMVGGDLFANVWQSDRIARIDVGSGQVTGWLELGNLLGLASTRADVLNGMAWDEAKQQLWVTGKLWPRIFVLEMDR